MAIDDESLLPTGADGNPAPAKSSQPRTSAVAYLGFVFIGMAPFLLVNCNWSEIPLYIQHQPEGESIGAYVGVAQQVANIIPFAFVFMVSKGWISPKDSSVVFFLFVLGLINALELAFFWHEAPGGISIPLLAGGFLSGTIGGMFVMVIWSFVAPFWPVYTSAMSAGMGLSGLIPAAYAIIQPKIHLEIRDYFLTFFGVLLVSCGAFALIVKKGRGLGVYRDNDDHHIVVVDGPGVGAGGINDTDADEGDGGGLQRTSSLKRLLSDPYVPIACSPPTVSTPVQEFRGTATVVVAAVRWKRKARASASNRASSTSDASLDPSIPASDGGDGRGEFSAKRLFMAAASPLLNMLFTNVITYVTMPGLPPYMVKGYHGSTQLLFLMTLFFMVANTLGRIFAGVYAVGNLFGGRIDGVYFLMALQTLMFVYMVAEAVTDSSLFLPHSGFTLIVIIFLFSLLNGYILTVIYCRIPTTDFKVGPNNDHSVSLVCRWAAVLEQLGALTGGFVCVAMVKGGAFPGNSS